MVSYVSSSGYGDTNSGGHSHDISDGGYDDSSVDTNIGSGVCNSSGCDDISLCDTSSSSSHVIHDGAYWWGNVCRDRSDSWKII